MAKPRPARFLIPDEKTPRFYGRLTLMIGSALLIFSVAMGGMYLLTPVVKPLTDRVESWANRFYQEGLRKKLDTLTLLEAGAPTAAEKARRAKSLDEFLAEAPADVKTMSPGVAAMEGPVVKAYGLVDSCVGVALNVALLIGAAGLTGLREWGRKTVLIVAGLKLARIVIFAVVTLGWIIPVQVRAMKAALGPMRVGARANAAAAAPFSGEMLAAMSTGAMIAWSLAAAVYPVLLLVMLSKPRVRAACVAAEPDGLGDG